MLFYPMFNNNGESKMYLVIERIEYETVDHMFSVVQQSESKDKANEYLKALNTLNELGREKKTYSVVEVAND